MNIRQPKPNEQIAIERFLALKQDELYSMVAESDPQLVDQMFSPEAKRKAGEEKLVSLKSQLHKRLCVDSEFCKKIDHPEFQDPIVLIASVADAISGTTLGIPPFIIATILVKMSLRSFCNCD